MQKNTFIKKLTKLRKKVYFQWHIKLFTFIFFRNTEQNAIFSKIYNFWTKHKTFIKKITKLSKNVYFQYHMAYLTYLYFFYKIPSKNAIKKKIIFWTKLKHFSKNKQKSLFSKTYLNYLYFFYKIPSKNTIFVKKIIFWTKLKHFSKNKQKSLFQRHI